MRLPNSLLIITFVLCVLVDVQAQTEEQKAMAKLSFMIGDWKGEGSSYPKEANKPYAVLSKVRYDLDGELLVLKHRSSRNGQAVLSLHTLIYYDKEEQLYYYYAFRRSGARPFKGTIVDGKFICQIDNYRLIFQRTAAGEFNEYGEKLVDGAWVKNFEDILQPSSEVRF